MSPLAAHTPDDNYPARAVRRGVDRSGDTAWIIVTIILGTLLLVAVLIAAVVMHNRRKQYRRERSEDPSLSHKEFQRRRRMTPAERFEEEEMQRSMMIRKSVTSRSMGMSSTQSSDGHSDRRSIGSHDDGDSAGLREDWKEWEARMQSERSGSPEDHPLRTSLPAHPIFHHHPTNPATINPVVVLPHHEPAAN